MQAATDSFLPPQERLDTALEELEFGNVRSSVPILEELLEQGSYKEQCLYALGVAMLLEHQVQAARKYFDRCLQADPKHANALYQLGELENKAGNISTAKVFFLQALSAHPGHHMSVERLESMGVNTSSLRSKANVFEPIDGFTRGLNHDSQAECIHRENTPIQPVDKRPSRAPQRNGNASGGIYDLILADTTPIGRQVLEALEAIEMNKTLSPLAFIGTPRTSWQFGPKPRELASASKGRPSALSRLKGPLFVFFWFLLVGVAVIVFLQLANNGDLAAAFSGPHAMELILSCVGLLCGLGFLFCFFRACVSICYKILSAITTRVIIHRGMLTINHGLLSRKQINIELYRIREPTIYKTFINRLLGQGSLVLELDEAGRGVTTVSIPGLVPDSKLNDLVVKIRDASQKLRQGQYAVKGIIC
jgi:hypothetical protein